MSLRDAMAQYYAEQEKQKQKQDTDRLSDFGYSLAQGALRLPEGLAGLVDIALPYSPVTKAVHGLEDLAGVDLSAKAEELAGRMSPEAQQFRAEKHGKGFLDTLGMYARQPGQTLNLVGETIPDMIGGGVIGKGIRGVAGLAGKEMGGITAGAIGEGAISAGQTMAGLYDDPNVNGFEARAAALTAGVGTALIARMGGKYAESKGLGSGDVESLLAGGISQQGIKKGVGMSIPMRMGLTTGLEGIEELAQAPFETVPTNIARDMPWDQGLGQAMAEGLVAGTAMGAGTSVVDAYKTKPFEKEKSEEEAAQAAVRKAHKNETTKNFLDDLKTRMEDMSADYDSRQTAFDEYDSFMERMARVSNASQDDPWYVGSNYIDAREALKDIKGVGPKAMDKLRAIDVVGRDSFIRAIEQMTFGRGKTRDAAIREEILNNPELNEALLDLDAYAAMGAGVTPSGKAYTKEEYEVLRMQSEQAKADADKAQRDYDTQKAIINKEPAPVDQNKPAATSPEEDLQRVAKSQEESINDDTDVELEAKIAEALGTGATTEDILRVKAANEELVRNAGVFDDPAIGFNAKSRMPDKPNNKTEAPAPQISNAENDRTIVSALVGLIDGHTPDRVAKLLKRLKGKKYSRVIGARAQRYKVAPELFQSNGKLRDKFNNQTMPEDIKKFFNTLLGYNKNTPMTTRARGQLRRRAAELADKYNYDPLRSAAAPIIAAFGDIHRTNVPLGEQTSLDDVLDNISSSKELDDNLLDLFDRIHALTNRFDTLNNVFKNPTFSGKNPESDVLSTDFHMQRLQALQTPADQRTPEQQRLVDEHRQTIGAEAAELGKRLYRPDSALKLKSMPSNIELVQEQLTEALSELQGLVGQKAIDKAQALSKSRAAKSKDGRKTIPLKAAKAGKQSQDAIRFSQMYKTFRENGNEIVSDFISSREMRYTEEEASKLGKATGEVLFEVGADGKVIETRSTKDDEAGEFNPGDNKIYGDLTKALKENPTTHPLKALLHQLRSSMTPATQVLTSHLLAILNQRSKTISEGTGTEYSGESVMDRIKVRVVNAKHPTARAMVSAHTDGRLTLTIYEGGNNPATILHEAIHLATIGVINRQSSERTKNQNAAVNDLLSLATNARDYFNALSQRKQKEIKQTNPRAYQILTKSIVNKDGSTNLDEFVTYSLTDLSFQRLLKDIALPKSYSATAINLWEMFTKKLAQLLGIGRFADKNASMFSAVLDAQGALLGEVYVASRGSADIFKPSEKFDEQKHRANRASRKNSIDAQDAWDNREGGYFELRAERFNTAAEDIKEEITKRVEEVKKERGVTAAPNISEGRRGKRRNANIIDAIEENVADVIAQILSPVFKQSFKTWKELSEFMLKGTGSGIVNWTKKKGAVRRMAGKVLSKVVDKYGQPEGYRNMTHVLALGEQGNLNIAHGSYESLVTLDEVQQQVLLDNLDSANYKENLQRDLPKDHVQAAIEAVDIIRHTYDKGVAEGIIKPVRGRLPSVRELIVLSNTGAFEFDRKLQINASLDPKRAYDKAELRVLPKDVLGKNGEYTSNENFGGEYLRGLRTTASGLQEPVAIEKGVTQRVLDAKGIVLDPADTRPYTFDRISNEGDRPAILTRYRTVAEHNKYQSEVTNNLRVTPDKRSRATAISTLTHFIHSVGRQADYLENVRQMLAMNEEAESIEDKWIVKGKPIPESDQITVPDEAKHIDRDRVLNVNAAHFDVENARVPGSWVAIPSTKDNIQKYGELAGHLVEGTVFASMQDLKSNEPVIKGKFFGGALATWKKSKTAFNLPAHVNNLLGNVTLAYFNDLPVENLTYARDIIIKDLMGKKLDGKEKALLDEMKTMGITLAQAKTADFDPKTERALSDFLREKFEGTNNQKLIKFFTNLEKIGDVAVDVYSAQDNIFRLAAYITTIQDEMASKGIPKGGDVGIEVKQKAAVAATQMFVDYQIQAPWIKAMRGSILPFLAWPYRMSGIMSRMALTKPWKIMNTLGVITAVNAAAYAALGMDEDDEDDERAILPEWHKGSMWGITGVPRYMRMPWTDAEGNAVFINLARIIPMADWNTLMRTGTPSLVNPGGPLPLLLNLASNNDPFTGKEIRSDTDAVSKQIMDTLWFGIKDMLPGSAVSAGKYFDTHVYNDKLNSAGYDYNTWVDTAKLFGLGIFQVNLHEAAKMTAINKAKDAQKYKAGMAKLRRAALRYRVPDYEELNDSLADMRERMYNDLNDLN